MTAWVTIVSKPSDRIRNVASHNTRSGDDNASHRPQKIGSQEGAPFAKRTEAGNSAAVAGNVSNEPTPAVNRPEQGRVIVVDGNDDMVPVGPNTATFSGKETEDVVSWLRLIRSELHMSRNNKVYGPSPRNA
ncbi:hypothetical protein EX895_002700 [Sporisorium graminicola]|uniref:Uncharacterized protein n=1 Tax=Sporisorium graminicola TaxID=280036 RepID=A0A4U7KY55_9BASI|nr:hypothetical protein EX895_002700 [Sporisorium graminicola]TKY88348.1 hypothetical protein EX895_002700 [Sporisorium graminicola]